MVRDVEGEEKERTVEVTLMLHVSIFLYRLHVSIYKPLDQKKGEDEERLRKYRLRKSRYVLCSKF